MKALFALVLVGCGAGTQPPPSTLKGTFEPTKPASPTTPAPRIGYVADQFQLVGFPAIARDRSVVAVPVIDSDGGRGYPNVRIELRFDSDKTFETIQVMTANEYETLVEDAEPTRELLQRLDKANARLREVHRQHDLVTMDKAENLETEFVIHDTYEIKYVNGAVKLIFDVEHSISFDHSSWKAPKRATMPGSPPCENPEHLERVYYAQDINAIVVEFGYQGTDLCWEPANQLHVLTW